MTTRDKGITLPFQPQGINVKDAAYGAKGDGVTDDSAAFNAAWLAIKETGGQLYIPPGVYYLNAQWLCAVSQTLPYNYSITGYGAQLLAGPAVTGSAILVYKGYNNFGVKIEGLHFNHRNNTTVNGCIQSQGGSNLRIIKCSVEHHNTKATYAGIEVGPYTPGDGNTNSFWTLIDGFTTRMRSGGDGTSAAVGIRFKGVANATKVMNCSFGGVTDAIRFDTDGAFAGLANGVSILHNDFEGAVNAITVNTAAPCTAMMTGLRVAFNRVESATTFFNITGAAVIDSGYPPIVENNYCTVGSVTNYILNPNNQLMNIWEPSYYGVGTTKNIVGGSRGFQIQAEGTGNNFELARLYGGPGSWNMAHLVMCGAHLWIESTTGVLRVKQGVPTQDADGYPMGPITAALAYSASMLPNMLTATAFTITATNGTAFTINNPSNIGAGQTLTFIIRNTSGGALGAITWGGFYKMSAWTNPANGFNRSITFQQDGLANFVQISQTGVDVPN